MCFACPTSIDTVRRDAFAARLLEIYNHGMINLLLSVGHRLGLFDAMASGEPVTARDLAGRLGLQERYVHEWLCAMVASRVVDRDARKGSFSLPPEHAAHLCRESADGNFAVYAQYLPTLAPVEDELIACFREGGGIGYERYPRFHEVMMEDSGQAVVPFVVDQFVPLFDGLRERLEAGADVLDIGCGCGRALLELASAFPASRFTGYDLSDGVVDHATASARERGLANVRFVARDLTRWEEPAAYDWILALDAIHDQARPDQVLAGIRKSLRPGGHFLMLDIDLSSECADNAEHPLGPMLHGISLFHCMPVSLAQGGMGLGAAWGWQRALEMLGQAGFADIRTHRFPHDIQNVLFLMTV